MKVLLGVGAYGDFITSGLGQFLYAVHGQKGHQFRLVIAHLFGHANMRNGIVAKFLESDAEALWFLDHDIVPPVDACKLLDTEGDIVAGYYSHPPLKEGNKTGACIWLKDESEKDQEGDIWNVRGVGMGATVIHRRVLEDERMIVESNDESGKHKPFFRFRWKDDGSPLLGEDYDFCDRARELGYRVVINNAIKFGHTKTMTI